MLKMLPEQQEPIFNAQIFAKITSFGRVHNASASVESSYFSYSIDLLEHINGKFTVTLVSTSG